MLLTKRHYLMIVGQQVQCRSENQFPNQFNCLWMHNAKQNQKVNWSF